MNLTTPLSLLAAFFALSAASFAEPLLIEDFSTATLPPLFPSRVIYDARPEKLKVHTPTIEVGKDDALVVAIRDFPLPGGKVPGDMDPVNGVRLLDSKDGGKTWSVPRKFDVGYAINPGFIRTAEGDLVLFYNTKNSDVQDDNSIWFCRSSDNFHTWTKPQPVDIGYRVHLLAHNGVRLRNGDLLLAFDYDRGNNSATQRFELNRMDRAAAALVSTDDGAKWKGYGEIEVPNFSGYPNLRSWPVEAVPVQTADGRVLMFLRTRAGHIWQSTSYDNGRQWTEAEPMRFSNNESKVAAITLANGHIVLLWNNCQVIDPSTKRFPLMASLSEDGGRTWPFTVTLADDPVTLQYPAVTEQGGELKIVHGYAGDEVRFLSLRESDLRHRWTAINHREAWRIADGVLQMTDDRAVESPYEWTRWPKVVTFPPNKPRTFVVEADMRFDGPLTDGALGIFSSYQDEDNWLAWTWSPAAGRAGIERRTHFGMSNAPAKYRESNKTWFTAAPARAGVWYHLKLTQRDDQLDWELRERDGAAIVASATIYTRYEGHFLAVGAQRVKASFDNIALTSLEEEKR